MHKAPLTITVTLPNLIRHSMHRLMKILRHYGHVLSIGTLCVASAAPNGQAPSHSGAQTIESQTYRSPDGALTAKVVSVRQTLSYGGNPSQIVIRDRTGHRIASRDHSMYPNQGLTVGQAAWTHDGRFFVYQTEQSGGHSPWHHPTFFYSRKNGHFYSLDAALQGLGSGDGAITEPLKLISPATVATTGRYYGKETVGLHMFIDPKNPDGERKLQINLRWLEAHLAQSALSTDAADRKARALADREYK